MPREGGFHLDDIRYIREDSDLPALPGLTQVPWADSMGGWVRRMGKHSMGVYNQPRIIAKPLHWI
jgi:hypothetical protein